MIHGLQMRIGEFAAAVGLNPKTIRYYEQINLLPAPDRTANGYRLYTATDRERLCFILKAKTIGLTLEEIREILDLRRDDQLPCAHVRTLIDRKLAAVDAQLRALAAFRADLQLLREEAAETMRADAEVCDIIERHGRSADCY
ncbi:MAG: heavy metal-responsive transcriptional regulator [Roseiflexaceae bacterium]